MSINGGLVTLTRLDDNTRLPQESYKVPIGAQAYTISIEWPLPGTTSWTYQPTLQQPWQLRAEELLHSQSIKQLDCDNWLAQQLVVIDNKGVALKAILSAAANTEGAHSVNVQHFMQVENSDEPKPARNMEVHLLSNITIFGIQYNHIIVIESALYLYQILSHNRFISPTMDSVDIPVFNLFLDGADDVFSSYNNWLAFVGFYTLALGGGGKTVSHVVKAPKQ